MEASMSRHRVANYLAGIGYASIFGLSFLVTKEALVALDPLELLALRFAVAALAMTALAVSRIVKIDYRGKSLRDLALVCVLQPILYFLCETFGVRESASSTAGIVLGALPAAVALLGVVMLGEHLSKRQTASLALSIAGVAVIVILGGAVDGRAGTLRGVLLLLGAVASATFYNIYSRKFSRVFTPVETTFAMMWSGALFFGALVAVRALATGHGFGDLLSRASKAWTGIAYLGLLSSVVAFFCVNFTLSRLKASQSIVFANLTTVAAIAAGVLLRGEAFGVIQVAGAAMIVIGVWGTNAEDRGTRGKATAERGFGGE